MRLIDADGSYTINANDNTGYSLEFGGGIISVADDFGHIVAEFDAWDAPTIDPESLRPQGEWVLGVVEPGYFTPGGNRPWICSECGKVISWMLDKPRENYCPNCGAKMKGGAE